MPQLSLKIGRRALTAGFGEGRGLYVKTAPLPMATSVSGSRFGGNGRSWFYGLLPGAKIDYQRKAGDKWKNAIVSASLSWISRNLPYSRLRVYEEVDGQDQIVVGHPLTALLHRPNKYYDGKTLLQATFLSLIAGQGNAYWWVKRNNIGIPIELWYLPHFDVWPMWDQKATTDNWIIGYAYRQNGITYQLKNEEVIHFRDGIDPENPRLGLDPLKPASREVVVDNEASGYAAQLLDNMCIPGILLSPGTPEGSFDPGDVDSMRAYVEEGSGGDNRFRPWVLTGNTKVDHMSFSPEEMALHTMQNRPEARLCAMIGLSPMVLGLLVGLEHSTYSNMETAEAAAWYNCIMPRIALICSELDTQALCFYPDSGNYFCGGDYRKVPALQDDMDAKYARLADAVGGPFLTPDEARQELGMPTIEGGDKLYPPPNKPPPPNDAGADAVPTKSPIGKNGKGLVHGTSL